MGRLKDLKVTASLSDLAKLLHYTPKGLSYVLYKTSPETKYQQFSVPKKNGGVRQIDAPQQPLKLLQLRLGDLLSDCLDEIEMAAPSRRKVSHGFHRGRGILTNAIPHRRRRYVLNIDLTDFFGSINFGRVRGFFIKDNAFALNPAVATVIAQIACHQNQLPQGSPCSPVISNLIARIMDVRLARLAKDNGCNYTRYADDLTFSTNLRTFPARIAKPNAKTNNKWRLMKALRDEIKNAGFAVNPKKTRMQIRGSRQEATGLVVNEKINVSQDYYRGVRSMAHSLFSTGSYHIPGAAPGVAGLAVSVSALEPLEGRFAHIYYVKARRDRTERVNKLEHFTVPRAVKELYRRYLFYKYCVDSAVPVLVTEGKTDIVYLKCAFRATHPNYPNLSQTVDGVIESKMRFVHPSYVNNSVLELGSSSSQMTGLINGYRNRLRHYRHCPLSAPVIIIADNDDGISKVLKDANKLSSTLIKVSTPNCMFHLTHNLYLVKTPHVGAVQKTCIEDLFPDALKNVKVDGKPFDIKKDHGDDTAYGKAIFAERVVRTKAKPADFVNFAPLLQAIDDAISDYGRRLAATAAPTAALAGG